MGGNYSSNNKILGEDEEFNFTIVVRIGRTVSTQWK